MTGAELKALRYAIGEAVYGNGLTLAETAKLCGLAPANGADTMRKWEEGEGPSGPVAHLMELYSVVADESCDKLLRETMARIIDRKVQAA